MKKRWRSRVCAVLLTVSCICGSLCVSMSAEEVTAEAVAVDMDELLDMDELYGWAATPGQGLETVTGGGDAIPQLVTTLDELTALAKDDIPRVIVIDGKISTKAYGLSVGSNKTIVGIDEKAQIIGGFSINNAENVIINNLNIKGTWPYYGFPDCVEIKNSHHIWLNHLSIWNSTDGNVDITMGSDYVTVSWCKLWYTAAAKKKHSHRLSCLVGSGTGHDDTDMDRLKVTYHHNWFADGLKERMPRVMYGRSHIYNNYYSCEDNSYCIGADCYASILVENNYFENVNNPHKFSYDTGFPAGIVARGNRYVNTKGSRETGQHSVASSVVLFDEVSYDYWLNAAEDIPQIVQEYCGPKNNLQDASVIPDALKEGTLIKGVTTEPDIPEYTGSFELDKTNQKNDNPITYEEETNTFTMHGQNSDGSNAYYTLNNPFKGYDFSEQQLGWTPYWEKGVTISYWVKVPETADDVAVLNFNLENNRQMERNDAAKYEMCKNYRITDESYSLGISKLYVDAWGRSFKVLTGYGENVCYNPLYPEEGCYYATSRGGPYYAREIGTNKWTYLNYIGEGYYKRYGARFWEEGGEQSQIKEANISGSFSIYASGTVGYRQDNWKGRQMNPNLPSYGSVLAAQTTNQFYYWGNGGTLSRSDGEGTITMQEKEEWHFVVVVIQNDWVQCYMDGIEMSSDYYLNWWGRAIDENAAGDSFNLGFGHKQNYRVRSTPAKGYQTGMTLLEFLSDENTELLVGGLGAGASCLGQDVIGTPDGVQIRDIQYYYIPVNRTCVLCDCIDLTLAPEQTPAEPKKEESEERREAGDLDGDGYVTIQDAWYALEAVLGVGALNEAEERAADVSQDEVVTLYDVQCILKKVLKITS